MDRARVVLVGAAVLALAWSVPAWAQGRDDDPPGLPPTKPPAETGPLPSLRADPLLVRKLDAARDYLRAEAWDEAIHVLQDVLDDPEDALVCVKRPGKDGREAACWTGARGEAARLLGTLPSGGREVYATRYGPRAQALLAEARRNDDADRVAEVARRYPHTAAAAEAVALLAAYHLDRGHAALAAVSFERLLDDSDGDRVPAATLFLAALAFRRAGDAARSEQAWTRLAARAPTGLRLGDRAVKLAELKKELDRAAVAPAVPPAPAPDGLPALETKWARPSHHEAVTRGWIQATVQRQEDRGEPVLPGAAPLEAAGRIVYRSYRGVQAVDPRTGDEVWEVPSAWSIDKLLLQPRHASSMELWFNAYLEVSPHVVYGNALLGTLSTDGARVYAVDELAIPPYRNPRRFGGRWAGQEPPWPDFGTALIEAASSSRLLALDAASGKVVWEVGGPGGDPEPSDLDDGYFLGPPLPLDHRLYVLTEKHNELALVCLNAADGALVWKQPLALAPTRLLLDPGRHIQVVRPVYADGVLVCPTNAGVVLGIDLLDRGLAWAYPYETEALTQSEPAEGRRGRASPPHVVAEWQVPATAIEQGRVVVAAPDERSIHCLGLRDGSLLWKVTRAEDDRFVAGVEDGKVLVVGKQSCRALDVADGKQVWQLDTGLPSGRGTFAGGVYYLPLRETAADTGPAVDAIDVGRGVVLARTPLPHKEGAGNLLFREGEVLSQTAAALNAYRVTKGEPK
jgi:outer membrane protein assembly factor BamB